MKQPKIIVLTSLLAVGLAQPNQAAPKQQAAETSKVFVIGKVQKPGSYNLSGQRRLVDAIAAAGGVVANPKSLRFSVQRGGKNFPVDWFGIISMTDPKEIVPLQSGDVLMVDVADSVAEPTVPSQRFKLSPKPEQKGFGDKGQFEFNGSTVRIVPLSKKGATPKQK